MTKAIIGCIVFFAGLTRGVASAPITEIDAPRLMAMGLRINGGVETNAEWRVDRDGSAVRYRFPEGRRLIESEDTAWILPPDAKCWYQTGGGCYEEPYAASSVRTAPISSSRLRPCGSRLRPVRPNVVIIPSAKTRMVMACPTSGNIG